MIDGNAKQIPKHKGDILRVAVNYICYMKTNQERRRWLERKFLQLARENEELTQTNEELSRRIEVCCLPSLIILFQTCFNFLSKYLSYRLNLV